MHFFGAQHEWLRKIRVDLEERDGETFVLIDLDIALERNAAASGFGMALSGRKKTISLMIETSLKSRVIVREMSLLSSV